MSLEQLLCSMSTKNTDIPNSFAAAQNHDKQTKLPENYFELLLRKAISTAKKQHTSSNTK